MTWQKINSYHLKNDNWTISKAEKVIYPYGLWHENKNMGFFKTADEAKARHEELKNDDDR